MSTAAKPTTREFDAHAPCLEIVHHLHNANGSFCPVGDGMSGNCAKGTAGVDAPGTAGVERSEGTHPASVTGFPPRRISLVATERMAHRICPIGHLASAG
jgi:hypothetical protein